MRAQVVFGLIVNVILMALVFTKFQDFKLDLLGQIKNHFGLLCIAIALLSLGLLFNALRVRAQFQLQKIDLGLSGALKVVYVSFFSMQIINFAGWMEIIRFVLIPGGRDQILKGLFYDKVVSYAAKTVLILSLFSSYAALSFLILLHPRLRCFLLPAVYSVVGFFFMSCAFSLAAFNNISGWGEGAKINFLTSLMPTMSDWGSREFIADLLVKQEDIIQGSIIFGIVAMVSSLPGLFIILRDPNIRSQFHWKNIKNSFSPDSNN